jgi:hypothetical protein
MQSAEGRWDSRASVVVCEARSRRIMSRVLRTLAHGATGLNTARGCFGRTGLGPTLGSWPASTRRNHAMCAHMSLCTE